MRLCRLPASPFWRAFLIALILGFAGLLPASAAQAGSGSSLSLDPQVSCIDAWSAVQVLVDPTGGWSVAEVRARAGQFLPPSGPHANLGPRHEAIWLKLRLRVDRPSPWLLGIDYPSLDRIDVYLPGAAQPVRLGRLQPLADRPLPSRMHAMPLDLPSGEHELLLRVQTRSTMVLPLTLSTPAAFQIEESRRQLLQGLMAGAALCLLVYSLAQWVSLRDAMFLQYAITLGGNTVFFLAYFGIGAQHLWGGHPWMVEHAPPLAVLIALVGAFLFIERALGVRRRHRVAGLALRWGAIVAGALALAYGVGLIDYRIAQLSATVLGPLPMVIAVPFAYLQAREGDRVSRYVLIGWGVYGISTLLMAGLLRGWIGADFWTQHAFQFGLMFEMVVWMHVLGVRIDEMRAAAQRASVERDTLRSLAHTDALTSLPNRRGLDDALARALPGARPDRMVAVYLLDLDGFKPVNDRHGHAVGDALLVGVAQRLQGLLRTSDTVARLGGDEFVVLARGLGSDEDARALGAKLLDAFAEPFDAEGRQCRVGLTIGYALAPLDGTDAIALLQRADAAMYAGKQAGRHCLRRSMAAPGFSVA